MAKFARDLCAVLRYDGAITSVSNPGHTGNWQRL